MFQLADIVMGPIKAMSNILLDDVQSQKSDGLRIVINIIKRIGTFIGARNAEDSSEISLLNNIFFGKIRILNTIKNCQY